MSYLEVVLGGFRFSGGVVTILAIVLAGGGELIWLLVARGSSSDSGSTDGRPRD